MCCGLCPTTVGIGAGNLDTCKLKTVLSQDWELTIFSHNSSSLSGDSLGSGTPSGEGGGRLSPLGGSAGSGTRSASVSRRLELIAGTYF